jgi:hypothetical protein
MSRIFVSSSGPSDWRRLLANPNRHWRPGKSALESAVAWEAAKQTERGLPGSIAHVLDTNPKIAQAELVIALPELRVDLPGGGHPSQNDVWALLRAGREFASLAVEAKSGEPLGQLVSEWLPSPDDGTPSGKPKRLEYLRGCLGLDGIDLSGIRYQLLHRAASAILMCERFGAATAILLVHSFGGSADDKSRDDYRRFAETMLCASAFESLAEAGQKTRLPLLLGWVTDKPASPEVIASAI